MEEQFPRKLARSTKRSRGRTAVEMTPIAIRSSVPISPALETRMRRKLVRRLGHAAPLLERGTIRFEDINGPRGGVDTECRIKLVVSGRPSLVATERGRDVEPAFDGASFKVQRALQRDRRKHEMATGHRYRGKGARTRGDATASSARQARTSSERESRKRPSTRRATAASSQRPHRPAERKPMKVKTARRAPSRKGVKAKARQAKRRVGPPRGARR